MNEDKCSARLLQIIANYLDVPIEQFMLPITDPEHISDIESDLNHRDVSIQEGHLLDLYCSLPDQNSKNLALEMIKCLAKYQSGN